MNLICGPIKMMKAKLVIHRKSLHLKKDSVVVLVTWYGTYFSTVCLDC